jgi:predicted SAM-dependent methyltransferase
MLERIKQFVKKRALKNKLFSAPKKCLNIGAGPDGAAKEYADWISIDREILDITNQENWKTFTPGINSIDNILAEHVWEHLTDEDTVLANRNCYTFLKPSGRLRIAVPDGFNIDKEYIENVKPGGKGIGSHDHKILYTYKIMVDRLEKAGFKKIELLEYWDENGVFHANPWRSSEGHIKRSQANDPRNSDGKLVYTSLIVDAIK